jgi:uncharacterized Zn finger protein
MWVVDVLLEDDYGLFDELCEYLDGRHAKNTWCTLADILLARLKSMKSTQSNDDFHRNYARERLSNWAIYALEQAGRNEEIIPLCEVEARKTKSYERLVQRLIALKRYQDAKKWIQEGIDAVHNKWPGIASNLRKALRDIHSQQKDWKTLATLHAEEFVLYPSQQTFTDCQKTATKANLWDKVRPTLLIYLEEGKLPWKQKPWPLTSTELNVPNTSPKNRFPMLTLLIDIAILEKKPDQVLHWYDQLPKNSLWGYDFHGDKIASAVQTHAPDRAVAIWKHMAEKLIAQTKPSAYEEAVQYLRKAGTVMAKQKKKANWSQYLLTLRQEHARKRRFLDILDGLDKKPIIKRNQ